MTDHTYFTELEAAQKRLRKHGFRSHPNEEDILLYAMSVEDKLDELYRALGLVAAKDYRGEWRAYRRQEAI